MMFLPISYGSAPNTLIPARGMTDRCGQNSGMLTLEAALVAGVALPIFEVISWMVWSSVASSVAMCYLVSRYVQILRSEEAYLFVSMQKVRDFVENIFTWFASFFKEEITIATQQNSGIVHPRPEVVIDTTFLSTLSTTENLEPEEVEDIALPVQDNPQNGIVVSSGNSLAFTFRSLMRKPNSTPIDREWLDRNGHLNYSKIARAIQWIHPDEIPLEMCRGLPPSQVAAGVLNLPRDVFLAALAQFNQDAGVPLLKDAENEEALSFLFDHSEPLEQIENSAVLKEGEEISESLMGSSWCQVSAAANPEWREERRKELGIEGEELLLLYLRDAEANKELKDTDPIVFAQGKIERKSSQKSRETLHFLLEETYGPSLAAHIGGAESLFSESAPPLTWGKFKEVLVAVAAQARYSDFKFLFRKIKGEPIEGFLCADCLKQEEREAIAKVSRFEDLKPEHIETLERAFRTVLVNGEAIPTLEAFFPRSKKYPQGFWSSSYFITNARIVQALSYVNALDPTDIALATAEYLGKTTSYLELKEGMVIPLPSCNNEKIYFSVEKVFKKEGVVFQIMAPVTEGQNREGEQKTLYLNFRGTQARLSVEEGVASLLRDLDWRGIGANFNDLDVISALAPYVAENQVLKMNAHSLGGVDAPRALVAILEAIDQGKLPCLKKIEVFCFNAPAPEPEVNERCKQVLKSLEAKGKLVKVDLTYVRFESDPVQKMGAVFVGAGNTSEYLNVQVINFNSEQIRSFKAHGAIARNSALKSAEFQKSVINRSTSDGLLEKILSHRYYWDANYSSFVSRAGDVVQWYGGALGEAALKPLHFMFYESGKLAHLLVNSIAPDAAAVQRRGEYQELNRLYANYRVDSAVSDKNAAQDLREYKEMQLNGLYEDYIRA